MNYSNLKKTFYVSFHVFYAISSIASFEFFKANLHSTIVNQKFIIIIIRFFHLETHHFPSMIPIELFYYLIILFLQSIYQFRLKLHLFFLIFHYFQLLMIIIGFIFILPHYFAIHSVPLVILFIYSILQ